MGLEQKDNSWHDPQTSLGLGERRLTVQEPLGLDDGHLSSGPCGKEIPNPQRSSPGSRHRVNPRGLFYLGPPPPLQTSLRLNI